MKTVDTMEELVSCQNIGELTWIQVNELKDPKSIRHNRGFGIHSLTVEDIFDTEQRLKAELFDTYLFITFKDVRLEAGKKGETLFDQISLILTQDTIITLITVEGSGGWRLIILPT